MRWSYRTSSNEPSLSPPSLHPSPLLERALPLVPLASTPRSPLLRPTMTALTQLYHLTLTPFPLSSLPPAEELLTEARSILDHAAWGSAKSWPLGLVTQVLPNGAIVQNKVEEGTQEKKGGFWSGGKSDVQKEQEGSTGGSDATRRRRWVLIHSQVSLGT